MGFGSGTSCHTSTILRMSEHITKEFHEDGRQSEAYQKSKLTKVVITSLVAFLRPLSA